MRRRGRLATCDRCDRVVKHSTLQTEFVMGRETGLLVCDNCWDPDHPQNFLFEIRVDDPKLTDNPRPDRPDRSLFGWRPIGNPATYLQSAAGTVRVRIG